MKFEFPDTGEGVTEGKFLDWKVDEGDEIEEDQVVGEAETDKAVVEIPAPADGHVKSLKASPGDTVEVGDVIMVLETEGSDDGETVEADEKEVEEPPEGQKDKPDGEKAANSTSGSKNSSEKVLALPKVRKLAEKKNVDLSAIKTGERITEEEVLSAAESGEGVKEKDSEGSRDSSQQEVKATPSVRKLAREKEVDIESIDGSGRGGKVTREDVIDATKSKKSGESSGGDSREVSHSVESSRETERVKMSGIKEKTAERMAESRFTAPHVTHVEKADVTELKELREEEKDEVEPHLTYLPFIMKAVTDALKDYPELNAELDTEEDEIVHKKYYDFNIAVDTEQGLLVPQIEDVDDKSIVELAAEISRKAEKAKSGDLTADEMANGTFSITNLGVIGGEEFTPIINYPQTAILGIGKISETAEVVDGEVVPRTTVKLSLSYDHRVVDGATGARFMNEVKENLENPEKMLLEL